MKRRRILYNEVKEENYGPKYWTRPRLILGGIVLIIFGFLFNFSLEEKINKWFLSVLPNNSYCPIRFEKIELSYFFPKIIIKKPTIEGSCFNQSLNKLSFQNVIIGLAAPSFYPLGIKLYLKANEGKTKINIYPTFSFFSHYLDIEETTIDNKIFSALSSEGKAILGGNLKIEATFKYASGTIEEGKLLIHSSDFFIPAQNIKGFELSLLHFKSLDINAHMTTKNVLQIDQIQLGLRTSPLDLKLKGNLIIDPLNFQSSQLQLQGDLRLSSFILTTNPFIKLFLQEEKQNGNYQLKLNGALSDLGPPQIK